MSWRAKVFSFSFVLLCAYSVFPVVGQPLQYVSIAEVLWIPPNMYEITVEARWLPCLCIEHRVTLEGGYALDWPEILVIKVIASWTVPVGQSLRAKATWECPKEGRYRMIATASHDLRHEVVGLFVPEFPDPPTALVVSILLAVTIARKKGNKMSANSRFVRKPAI